ncbi:hypothetical protein HYH03_013911 [Edaphochlamys debaryana]|uniref:Uncharacterized protein n=1 Tax=Edaphochlamys debaryana TaxID=47281 RepID=A0A835XQ36_9CHLO|nr:hypothetical protein HYH03_013911 [Edaphochlamys debaryana]|eukprot:KAG2487492.1 hypothetical protein HYH03_013911 [Edaphochlamys debaryana]
MASADADPAIRPDPVAAVWASPALLSCAASFLDLSQAAWSFIRVNKAAAAAFDIKGRSSNGQLLPRTVSLRWLLGSGLLATPEGRAHAQTMCYGLTLKQRVRLLCLSAASGCSQESLGAAVVAVGLSPPPMEVLVSAASAGRLAECRWLVEELGCPGLNNLACLCLLSAAGTAGVAAEALAWLEPGAKEGWSEEQVAKAASGDTHVVAEFMFDKVSDGELRKIIPWLVELLAVAHRKQLDQRSDWSSESIASLGAAEEFYLSPHAAQAVARLAELPWSESYEGMLHAACKAGHAEAVRHLLEKGMRPDKMTTPDAHAARRGHLGVVQALHEAGCLRDPACCFMAGLEGGSLPAASWLVETFTISDLLPAWGPPRLESWLCSLPVTQWLARTYGPALGFSRRSGLYAAAARSGSVVVMEALPGLLGEEPQWSAHAASGWPAAAASGCEAAVDWLAARGVGFPRCGHEYVNTARNGDLRMLLRLRKLGCPYGYLQAAEALAQAASCVPAAASALPWLAEPGCPSNWGEAAAEARAEKQGPVPRLTAALPLVITVLCFCSQLQAIGLGLMRFRGGDTDPHDGWSRVVSSYMSYAGMLVFCIRLFIQAKRRPTS